MRTVFAARTAAGPGDAGRSAGLGAPVGDWGDWGRSTVGGLSGTAACRPQGLMMVVLSHMREI